MSAFTRRTILSAIAASGAGIAPSVSRAQQSAPAESPGARFSYDDLIKKAADIAAAPFDGNVPPLPEALAKLDFDAWREIRFRPDKGVIGKQGSPFTLQTFHLGHLFKRAVKINILRDGLSTPYLYSPALFDYGKAKFDKPLPPDLGFAGFRVHYPLNHPKNTDELVSFLGSSYFRVLGRGQQYGLSARALSVNTGLLDNNEEFPFYREFWIDAGDANSDHVTILALLDSASLTGAYRFDVFPREESVVEVTATVFTRSPQQGIGMAPLTSMFFMGENDRHYNDRNHYDDFRPEMHDSDGLLIQSGKGDWSWRPLKNPFIQKVSYFDASDIRGYGLAQRDRAFDHYQDIELAYEARPTYWIEPRGKWGEGRLELIELATKDETADNVVLAWRPKEPVAPGKPFSFGYRLTALLEDARLSPAGRVVNTFSAPVGALGSGEQGGPGSRRFMMDFAGGDVGFHLVDAGAVEVVASVSNGKIVRSFITPNAKVNGLRATIDVSIAARTSTDMRVFLRAAGQPLTETWVYTWNDE
jgi:glucans biosynthesis protein